MRWLRGFEVVGSAHFDDRFVNGYASQQGKALARKREPRSENGLSI